MYKATFEQGDEVGAELFGDRAWLDAPFKFKFSGNVADGSKVMFTGTQADGGDMSAKVEMEAKVMDGVKGTLAYDTKKDLLSLKTVLPVPQLDGLKINTEDSYNFGTKKFGTKAEADFTLADKLSGTASVEWKQGDTLTMKAKGAVDLFEGVVLGGKVEFEAHSKDVKKSEVLLGYKAGDFNIFGAACNKDFSLFKLECFGPLTSSLSAGVNMTVKRGKERDPKWSAGAVYKIDGNQKIKAKLDDAGLLSLLWKSKMSSAEVSLGAELNIKESKKDLHNLQVSIALL